MAAIATTTVRRRKQVKTIRSIKTPTAAAAREITRLAHDLDILLALVGEPVVEVKAVGIPVLSDKVDIAHARLEFSGGAVANVTASRVSTERVRKVRFFQQHEYVSLDYARRDALRVSVKQPATSPGVQPEFSFEKLPSAGVEPLHAELEAFLSAVGTRQQPKTNGTARASNQQQAIRVWMCLLFII